MNKIKNRFNGKTKHESKNLSIKNLAEKNSSGLYNANLRNANLRNANLRNADLYNADLYNANLRNANLRNANLRNADLRNANLRNANLRNANLRNANLRNADLYNADLEFYLFPSIRLLSSIPLGLLSKELTLELMRRDAHAHPFPEKFTVWANGGDCPYQKEEIFWRFEVKKELWREGIPQMTDRDLILAICKEKNWKIKGHL